METTILIKKKHLDVILKEAKKYPSIKIVPRKTSFFTSGMTLEVLGTASEQMEFHRYLDTLYPLEK